MQNQTSNLVPPNLVTFPPPAKYATSVFGQFLGVNAVVDYAVPNSRLSGLNIVFANKPLTDISSRRFIKLTCCSLRRKRFCDAYYETEFSRYIDYADFLYEYNPTENIHYFSFLSQLIIYSKPQPDYLALKSTLYPPATEVKHFETIRTSFSRTISNAILCKFGLQDSVLFLFPNMAIRQN